jgi:phosphatidate cytidylyltransferase
MRAGGRSWDDLRPRVITGAVLTVIGVAVIWAGGWVFALAAAVVIGLTIWELAAMIAPERRSAAVQLALLSALAVLLARALPGVWTLPLLIAPGLAGAGMLRRHPVLFAVFTAGILIAGYGLVWFRDSYSVTWMYWLVFTVVVTDVAGYFGGKSLGGPKFWPRVSPKKTWAGVISGWVAAAALGAVFYAATQSGAQLVIIAVLLSFASQLGDIAESAVKRLTGVKDASTLLPGHGGFFDRFDGMLGASIFMLLAALVVDVPTIII